MNLLIRHVLKCVTLLPVNPALPMVEVAVLLVVKKCWHASGERYTRSTEETIWSFLHIRLTKYAESAAVYKIVIRLFEWAKTSSNAG